MGAGKALTASTSATIRLVLRSHRQGKVPGAKKGYGLAPARRNNRLTSVLLRARAQVKAV
jgi:hypothetical protein